MGVAFGAESFAFGGSHIADAKVGVKLDADGAGDFFGDEIDFGGGGEGLRHGIKDGVDVVMLREESRGDGSLGAERSGAKQESAQKKTKRDFCVTGHLGECDPFRLACAEGSESVRNSPSGLRPRK